MDKNKKINYIHGIIISALLALTGIALIVNAIVIFKTGGNDPYTRSIVGKHLLYIMPIGILTVLAIAAGIVIKFKFPCEIKKLTPEKDEFVTLERVSKKLGDINPETPSYSEISNERKKRNIIKTASACAVSAIGLFAFLFAVLFDYSSVDSKINSSVFTAALVVIASALSAGAIWYIKDRLMRLSAIREYDLIKSITSDNKNSASVNKASKSKKSNTELFIKAASVSICVLALNFIILGLAGGGVESVLGKAVRICTECVGLG